MSRVLRRQRIQKTYVVTANVADEAGRLMLRCKGAVNRRKMGKHRRGTVRLIRYSEKRIDHNPNHIWITLTFTVVEPLHYVGNGAAIQKFRVFDFRKLLRILAKANLSGRRQCN